MMVWSQLCHYKFKSLLIVCAKWLMYTLNAGSPLPFLYTHQYYRTGWYIPQHSTPTKQYLEGPHTLYPHTHTQPHTCPLTISLCSLHPPNKSKFSHNQHSIHTCTQYMYIQCTWRTDTSTAGWLVYTCTYNWTYTCRKCVRLSPEWHHREVDGTLLDSVRSSQLTYLYTDLHCHHSYK